jgi:hypothetical protein
MSQGRMATFWKIKSNRTNNRCDIEILTALLLMLRMRQGLGNTQEGKMPLGFI